jgi:hypothetical protein
MHHRRYVSRSIIMHHSNRKPYYSPRSIHCWCSLTCTRCRTYHLVNTEALMVLKRTLEWKLMIENTPEVGEPGGDRDRRLDDVSSGGS